MSKITESQEEVGSQISADPRHALQRAIAEAADLTPQQLGKRFDFATALKNLDQLMADDPPPAAYTRRKLAHVRLVARHGGVRANPPVAATAPRGVSLWRVAGVAAAFVLISALTLLVDVVTYRADPARQEQKHATPAPMDATNLAKAPVATSNGPWTTGVSAHISGIGLPWHVCVAADCTMHNTVQFGTTSDYYVGVKNGIRVGTNYSWGNDGLAATYGAQFARLPCLAPDCTFHFFPLDVQMPQHASGHFGGGLEMPGFIGAARSWGPIEFGYRWSASAPGTSIAGASVGANSLYELRDQLLEADVRAARGEVIEARAIINSVALKLAELARPSFEDQHSPSAMMKAK